MKIGVTPTGSIMFDIDESVFLSKCVKYVWKLMGKQKYVLFNCGSHYYCGILSNTSILGGESITVKDVENDDEKVVQWNSVCAMYDDKETALIELKNKIIYEFSESSVTPIRSSRSFYEMSANIHKECNKVKILAKTPGVLIKEQERSKSYRTDYFRLINSKLYEGEDYELNYLFDKNVFVGYLEKCLKNCDEIKIEQSKLMLMKYLSNYNFLLKCGRTYPLTGSVIGMDGDDPIVACVGFKERLDPAIKEGALIKSPSLLKIINQQYDSLFEEAEVVTADFIDKVIQDIK